MECKGQEEQTFLPALCFCFIRTRRAGDQGPMAALEKAKKDGLTRFVGITGHNRPEKFARVVAKRDFDVMMKPVSISLHEHKLLVA